MGIYWDIEPRCKIEIWGFTGINFSGQRSIVHVSARGQVFGDVLEGHRLKSIGIIAYPGIQVTLASSADPYIWEDFGFRTFRVVEGNTHTMKDGRPALQIPDIDVFDPPTAVRSDPEMAMGYEQVERLADGTTWSFGRTTTLPLKCRVRQVRIERFER